MTFISTPLPKPPGTLVSSDAGFTQIDRFDYIYSCSDSSYVARQTDGELFVKSSNNLLRTYNATSGDYFADNFWVNDQHGFLVLPQVRSNGLHYRIIEIFRNFELFADYLDSDTSVPSVAVDLFNGRLIVYKADVKAGERYYIFSIQLSGSFSKSTILVGNATEDATLHLFFNRGANEVWRSLEVPGENFSAIQKIDDLAQAYNRTATSSFTANNINSNDMWFPVLHNGNIYVLNKDTTQFSAWSATVANDQVLLPRNIDSRASAHSNTIAYPRLQVDTNTDVLYDTKSFFSFDTSNLTEAANYRVCLNSGTFEEDFLYGPNTNKTTVRRLHDNGYATYKFGSVNKAVQLHSSEFCQIKENIQGVDANLLPGTQFAPINFFIGHRVNSSNLTDAQVYYLSNEGTPFFYTHEVANGRQLVVGSATAEFPTTENHIKHCKIRLRDGRCIYRSDNNFYYYNNTSIQTIPAINLPSNTQRYCFVFNEVFYVIAASGISLLDLTTLAPRYVPLNWARLDSVKLFLDYDGSRLFLHDIDHGNIIYQLNVAPAFDFTDRANYLQYVTVVSSALNTQNTRVASSNWQMYQLNNEYTYYVDYINRRFEIFRKFVFSVHSGLADARADLNAPISVAISKTYIFDRNINNLISYGGENFDITTLNIVNEIQTGTNNIGNPTNNFTFSVDNNGKTYLAAASATEVVSYVFESRFPAVKMIRPPENVHHWVFRNNAEILLDFSISNKSIARSTYTRSQDLSDVNEMTFQSATAFEAFTINDVYYNFEATYHVNQQQLALILALYEQQWNKARTKGSNFRIYFDDLRDITPSFAQRVKTDNYLRFIVVLTDYPMWKWLHKDYYEVKLKFTEVEFTNEYDTPLWL